MLRKINSTAFTVLVVLLAQSITSLEIVKRSDWGAKEPKEVELLNGTVPYVVIHHSYVPGACFSEDKCCDAMRSMQSFHQIDRNWFDIGYNFGVGGDGKVYEGRGFNVVGAHAMKYNSKSIGICLIGNWQEKLPNEDMLKATKELIALAVEQGFLATNYTLIGHRQVRDTACPGPALYNEIKTWPHFGSPTN